MVFRSGGVGKKLVLSCLFRIKWFQWVYAWATYLLKKEWPTADLHLKVPRECNLRANVYSGFLSVDGITGQMQVQVGSGKAIVSKCTGNLRMLLSGAECTIKSFSGSVSIYSYTGDIDFNGELFTESTNRIESLTGTIKASLVNPDLKFNAKASTGQVTLVSEDGAKQNAKTQAYGTIGNGKGSLQLKTSIGNITIETVSDRKSQP